MFVSCLFVCLFVCLFICLPACWLACLTSVFVALFVAHIRAYLHAVNALSPAVKTVTFALKGDHNQSSLDPHSSTVVIGSFC